MDKGMADAQHGHKQKHEENDWKEHIVREQQWQKWQQQERQQQERQLQEQQQQQQKLLQRQLQQQQQRQRLEQLQEQLQRLQVRQQTTQSDQYEAPFHVPNLSLAMLKKATHAQTDEEFTSSPSQNRDFPDPKITLYTAKQKLRAMHRTQKQAYQQLRQNRRDYTHIWEAVREEIRHIHNKVEQERASAHRLVNEAFDDQVDRLQECLKSGEAKVRNLFRKEESSLIFSQNAAVTEKCVDDLSQMMEMLNCLQHWRAQREEDSQLSNSKKPVDDGVPNVDEPSQVMEVLNFLEGWQAQTETHFELSKNPVADRAGIPTAFIVSGDSIYDYQHLNNDGNGQLCLGSSADPRNAAFLGAESWQRRPFFAHRASKVETVHETIFFPDGKHGKGKKT